ncbi:MAG: transposase [Pirellulales bacterium]
MPRTGRIAPGGMVFHAINRAVARLPLLVKDDDYLAFEKVLDEALERHPTRLLGYCLMPNHWHMVLWPRKDGELMAFLRWVARLHRWPISMPPQWLARVNRPQREAELAALRSVNRGAPFGSPAWQRRTARRLGLQYTLRPRGRPRKAKQ